MFKIKYLIYILIVLYTTYNVFFDKNIFTYTNYDNWVANINGRQIDVFNDYNYCIKTDSNLLHNYYTCCQNVQLKKNNFDIESLYEDKSDFKNVHINYINTTKYNNSMYVWVVIGFGIIYLIISLFYNIIYIVSKFVSSFIGGFLDVAKNKLFGDNKTIFEVNKDKGTLSEVKNNSSSIFDTSSIFDNIFGSETSIEVKEDKDASITIDNFIGCENIKKDINKLILQINYESIYKSNGCELPKGLLLLGPPGVGKTHLVKTIINSTGMKHIFISGSDFNKKYVGSGSSTVSKLFKKARENKPCLIFIDEADTILKKRSHSESSAASIDFNSTICKFLEEMDSLKTESGVIVIFASNMDIDYIDKGMIRAGRVDQIINISYPTFEERIDLFKMYLGDLYDDKFIDINKISKLSYGLTGSDIKKIINLIKINKVNTYVNSNQEKLQDYKGIEHSLFFGDLREIANENSFDKSSIEYNINNQSNNNSSKNSDENSDNKSEEDNINIQIKITTDDIDKEISKCILGMERERKINEMNKKIIAYHEAGHAIIGFLIANSIIPTKICISINSKSLGYTMFPQDDDDLLVKTTISQLMIEVMILYGGRMSEKIFINDITCGGEDDYSRARKILKRLLMNGMLVLENNYIELDEGKNIKPNETIEAQLKSINKIVINEIETLLSNNSEIVHDISNMIIECGSITSDDIYEIFKKNNANEKIGSYDIYKIINEIKQIL